MAFCHLEENLVMNMLKNQWMLQKTGIDAAETASKRVVQKTGEVLGDLIGNKMADKIKKKKKMMKHMKYNKFIQHQENVNKLLMI